MDYGMVKNFVKEHGVIINKKDSGYQTVKEDVQKYLFFLFLYLRPFLAIKVTEVNIRL
jgi:hypothetical protein